MRLVPVALVIGLLASVPASAQNESVTVTGKSVPPPTREQVLRGFIKSYVAPSKVLGKIARWADPICPGTVGLDAEKNAAISDRIRKVAAMVGAPVRPNTSCRTNVVIVFAADPQNLLDEIAKHYSKYRGLIGDVDGPSHARIMARVKYPVQAWYGTEILDYYGNRVSWDGGTYVSNGSRLSNGVSSVFTNVFVVVDLRKAVGYQVDTMADYVAMLALSQTGAYDSCKNLPSITNLLIAGCDSGARSTELSDADLAYLRGVYKMSADSGINLARSDILTEMEKSTAGLEAKTPPPAK